MNIAVSIIIPIYNAEKFIKKGLDSCVNQTMQNIEVICVNDASTDHSGEIIQEYASRYPDKIVQINLGKNSGPGGARNQGILQAKGEYLCFMDSDDQLDTHLCEEVYFAAKEQDADLVFYDYIRVDSSSQYPVELTPQKELDYWYQPLGYAPWQHMIKKEIILKNELFMPENACYGEDMAVTPLWKYYAKKRVKLNKSYYHYTNRELSLTNDTKISSILVPITKCVPYRFHMMRQRGIVDKHPAESCFMLVKDISDALIRLLKSDYLLGETELWNVRKKLAFLDGSVIDNRIIKWCLPCAERDMVYDFLYRTDIYLKKHCKYKQFINEQAKLGFDKETESEIKYVLSGLMEQYGEKIAVWGVGDIGIPAISTLLRMGYDIQVYDNAKHGQEIWDGAHTYIHAFDDLEKEAVQIILIASTTYYKAIEQQIHEKYPDIVTVNFMQILRCGAQKALGA